MSPADKVIFLAVLVLMAVLYAAVIVDHVDRVQLSADSVAPSGYYTVRVVIPADTISICTDFIPAAGDVIQADQVSGRVVSVRPLY